MLSRHLAATHHRHPSTRNSWLSAWEHWGTLIPSLSLSRLPTLSHPSFFFVRSSILSRPYSHLDTILYCTDSVHHSFMYRNCPSRVTVRANTSQVVSNWSHPPCPVDVCLPSITCSQLLRVGDAPSERFTQGLVPLLSVSCSRSPLVRRFDTSPSRSKSSRRFPPSILLISALKFWSRELPAAAARNCTKEPIGGPESRGNVVVESTGARG